MVCVFARKTTEPLTGLVKQIDEKIGENGKLKSFVVILNASGEKSAAELRALAKAAGIKQVPLTMSQDPAGVPDYEIAKDADVTVVMWRGQKVRSARGYKGELSEGDIAAIVAEIPKLLND